MAPGTDAVVAGAAPDIVPVPGAVAAGAAVIGPAIGAVEAGAGAVPAGAGSFGAWEWLPQAESTSAQATTSAGIFRFVIRSPWPNAGLSGCNAPHGVKVGAVCRREPITRGAMSLTPNQPAQG